MFFCPLSSRFLFDRNSFVAIGVLFDKSDRILAHVVNVQCRFPIQNLLGKFRNSYKSGDVAWPPIRHNFLNGFPGSLLEGGDQFEDACAFACPQIDGHISLDILFLPILQFEGERVSPSEIHHMNVVANASSIRRRIICPKHVQVWQMAARNSLNVRHQVVWGTFGVFTN